jgi:hypothetical protein
MNRMDEHRIDRIEEMLSTLISMVGSLNLQFKEMKFEQQEMKKEQMIMRSENKKQCTDVHKTLNDMRFDQDHIWEKVVRNEREFAVIKGHLQL